MKSNTMSTGEFPTCGCHYTTDDDGIHFCTIHKAAPELLEGCLKSLQEFVALRVTQGMQLNKELPKSDIELFLEGVIAKAEGKI